MLATTAFRSSADPSEAMVAEVPIQNRPPRREIWVQLDERSRPETATGVRLINSLANVCRPDTAEAAREAFVFCNKLLAEREDVHQTPSCRSDCVGGRFKTAHYILKIN